MADKTYEMLWDCSHCGTQKNLGLTHRHCPSCGAPQDETRRYFPAEHEKVAVEDHRFAGADKKCQYCGTASGAAAQCCPGCGAPLDGSQAVQTRQDQLGNQFAPDSAQSAQAEFQAQAAGMPMQQQQPQKKKRAKWPFAVGGCFVVILVAVAVIFFWKRTTGIAVAGHSWTRSIAIDEFGPVRESEWCDRMPADAYSVSRNREVRDHRRVQDGERCQTRRVDNGDGTYSERRECTPTYRQEPIYDFKCTYQVNKWHPAQTLSANGASLAEAPHWPAVQITRPGQCLGCQREGRRTETYSVHFVDESNERSSCTFPQQRWATFQIGSTWTAQTTVIGSMLDCTTLRAAN